MKAHIFENRNKLFYVALSSAFWLLAANAQPAAKLPAAAAADITTGGSKNKQLTPLIPLRLLFGPSNYTSPQLSPNGKYLAYIGPSKSDGVYNVFIKTLPEPGQTPKLTGQSSQTTVSVFALQGTAGDKQVTFDNKRGVTSFQWLWDNSGILYRQDSDGDENYHLYLVQLGDVLGKNSTAEPKATDLTPFKGVRADDVFRDKRFPRQLYVTLNKRDPRSFDLYKLDLNSKKLTLDTINPGPILYWLFDYNFTLKGVQGFNNTDGSWFTLVRDTPTQKDVRKWRKVLDWKFGDDGTVFGFNKAGDQLFVATSVGRDTTELQAVSVAPGAKVVRRITSNPYADLDDVIFDQDTWEPQLVSHNYHKSQWTVVDPKLKGEWKRIEEFKPGFEVDISDMSADRNSWVLQYSSSNTTPAYYLYRKGQWPPVLLLEDRPELKPYRLAEVHPVIITARDGLKLPAYVTLPIQPGIPTELPSTVTGIGAGVTSNTTHSASLVTTEAATQSKPLNLSLPMVLLVHGGPWARDYWAINSNVQQLANRGYAVLQVNFRGSVGFGKNFTNAGNGEWGVGAMQHDLTDAVKWAVASGIADPKRICIAGASYGGYATLAGLAFTPDLYRCGVDIVGISNVATVLDSMPPYWSAISFRFFARIGDAIRNQTLNKMISPLFHADKIRAPLLIAQGANDPRVRKAEADQIYKAIKQRNPNLDVEYVLYPDEGHGFVRPDNRLDFNSRIDTFLARHLGGRSEPQLKVAGSSAKVITKV